MSLLQSYYEQMEKTRKAQDFKGSDSSRCFYKKFLSYCEENNYDEITKEVVDAWLSFYPYKTNRTKVNHIGLIKNLSTFIVFLGKEAFIPNDEYNFKIENFVPLILSPHKISEIMEGIDKENNITYSILFRLMYCCGLRPGEVTRLERNDFDTKTGDLYIKNSKNKKDRHIIVSAQIKTLCDHYDLLAGERKYFFSSKNKQMKTNRLSKMLRFVIKKYNLEFAKGFRPYDFRHNFATQNIMNWLDNGLDIMTMLPYLSTYMGHKKFSYTYYYIHLLPERLLQSKNVDWDSLRKIYSDEAFYGKN